MIDNYCISILNAEVCLAEFSTPLPSYSRTQIQDACRGGLHPHALVGIHLFNACQFFDAHEALEAAWMDESGPFRDVYRGILQTSVAYLHIQRNNYRGAKKMLTRCQDWLAPFPAECRGIDLNGLRSNIRAVETMVTRLGPDGIAGFDPALFKPVIVNLPPP